MRQDKLATRFQEALADAQSIAVGNEQQYIEPLHLLAAMLRQPDSAARSLLQRSGVADAPLAGAVEAALKRLPQVQGSDNQVQVSRELVGLLNQTDKEAQRRGDAYIAIELFLLALVEDKGDAGRLLRDHGGSRKSIEAAIDAVRGGEAVGSPEAEAQREALKKYTIDLTERARAAASSTRSSAATMKSAARSRSCSGARRTIRC